MGYPKFLKLDILKKRLKIKKVIIRLKIGTLRAK